MIKEDHIHYLKDEKGKIKIYKPWLGDIFSFMYDRIMEKSIFPKKFEADINKHFEILKREFAPVQDLNILEIATGSGNAIFFLPANNSYTGIDISPGLLKRAFRRFKQSGYDRVELYLASADEMPFQQNVFEFAFCNLSLNFFGDIELFIRELKRVLKPGNTFFCSVPVPERKPMNSKIRGSLYTENELKSFFEKHDFSFESKPYENGAILYFTARSGRSGE